MALDILELCDLIRQTGFEIHEYFGNGFLEKVYENALAHRLRKQGLRVEQQLALAVRDIDGTILGDYFADIVVEDVLIVEVKATRNLAPEHHAQVLGYLKASGLQDALLINFGGPKYEIKKFIWNSRRDGAPE